MPRKTKILNTAFKPFSKCLLQGNQGPPGPPGSSKLDGRAQGVSRFISW